MGFVDDLEQRLKVIHANGGPMGPLDETALHTFETQLIELVDDEVDNIIDFSKELRGLPYIGGSLKENISKLWGRTIKHYIEQTTNNTASAAYIQPNTSEDAFIPLAQHHNLDEGPSLLFAQRFKQLTEQNSRRRGVVYKKETIPLSMKEGASTNEYNALLFRLDPFKGLYQGHVLAVGTKPFSAHIEEGFGRIVGHMDTQLALIDVASRLQRRNTELTDSLRAVESDYGSTKRTPHARQLNKHLLT